MFAVGCSWLQLVEVDKLDKVGLDKVGLDKGGCSFYTGYENRNQPGCGFLWLVAVYRLDKGGCGFYTGYEIVTDRSSALWAEGEGGGGN